ncbi:MAG: methylmalonyl-CoA epimerase [Candidatus Bipolaricaulia bacterium]
MKLDHIGIAVKDLEMARANYQKLGLEEAGREELVAQKVEVCLFELGGTRIELLWPLGEGPLAGFLERQGEGLHHLAIEVADIEGELQRLREAGVQLVEERPREGLGGSKIAFIHPKSMNGVLIELVERTG